MARKLSLSRAWDETRGIFARDGKLIVSVALAMILLPVAIAGLVGPPQTLSGDRAPSWMPLLSLVVALVGVAGQLAIVRLALTSSTVRDAIAHGFRRLLPAFLALLLLGLAVALVALPIVLLVAGPEGLERTAGGGPPASLRGAILLVLILVLAIAARFQLIMPVAAAEQGGPIRVIKRSWQATEGHYWRLLAFVIVTLFLGFIVVLYLGQVVGGTMVRAMFGDVDPFSLGALIAGLILGFAQAVFAAVLSVMLARIYAQVTGEGLVEASVPSSGT